MRITDMHDDGVTNLCIAITENAIEDYFRSRFFLDTRDLRRLSIKHSDVVRNERHLVQAMGYFDTPLFHSIYPTLEFEDMMNILNDRYYNEEFFHRFAQLCKTKKMPGNVITLWKEKYKKKFVNDRVPVNVRIKELRKERDEFN